MVAVCVVGYVNIPCVLYYLNIIWYILQFNWSNITMLQTFLMQSQQELAVAPIFNMVGYWNGCLSKTLLRDISSAWCWLRGCQFLCLSSSVKYRNNVLCSQRWSREPNSVCFAMRHWCNNICYSNKPTPLLRIQVDPSMAKSQSQFIATGYTVLNSFTLGVENGGEIKVIEVWMQKQTLLQSNGGR